MSRKSGWVPIDKNFSSDFSEINRPYSRIEAIYSYSIDRDNGKSGTISGYSKLWGWSRNKVRRFIKEVNETGHLKDRKRTGSGHPAHYIDKGLWGKQDRNRTETGQKQDTTNNPKSYNPKDTKKKNKQKEKDPSLKSHLKKSINNGLTQYSEKITEFFDYRMSLKPAKRYKSVKGIDGLMRDIRSCKDAGLDVIDCLDIAMEREWLRPDPKYYKNEQPKLVKDNIMSQAAYDTLGGDF